MIHDLKKNPEILHHLFGYNPEEGILYWLPRPQSMFKTYRTFKAWNSKNAGMPAYTAVNKGYHYGRTMGNTFMAHRVIWLLQTGKWPDSEVDHIDGDRSNNKWENLRLATHSQNNMNKSALSNNTSGVKGVFWNKRIQKWQSQIGLNGKRIHLGYYENIKDAAAAYASASLRYHGEYGRPS
jgi:hypothetical protein